MRTYSLFTRFFVAVVFTTITSLAVAGFSAKKAYDADPQIVAKLEEKYNVHISIAGLTVGNRSPKVPMQDEWQIQLPKKKLVIKSFGGDIAMKTSNDSKIKITATGHLDKSSSDRLLQVLETSDEVTISEPEDAVKNLEVRIEIPTSFSKELEVVSVSGDVTMENLTLANSSVKTVSGEVTLNQINAPELSVNTISGDTKIHNSSLKSVSGKSISGEIEIDNKESADTHIKSISGDIKLKMPKTKPFQFNLKTISGDIKNEHAVDTASKLTVEISTTSGDITIQ